MVRKIIGFLTINSLKALQLKLQAANIAVRFEKLIFLAANRNKIPPYLPAGRQGSGTEFCKWQQEIPSLNLRKTEKTYSSLAQLVRASDC